MFVKKITNIMPTWQDIKDSSGAVLRGSAIGSVLGILPGGGALLSSFAAYTLEKKIGDPSNFGKGEIRGVAAPESANNAGAQTSFIPMLTLGIPSNVVMALMIGAMMIQGIAPGPQVMTEKPDLFWGLIVSMYVGNMMLVVLNVPMIGVWVSMLRIPNCIFLPMILLAAIVGSYSVNNSMHDVYLLLLFGIVGYLLRKFDFQLAPLVVGLVLGPLIEKHLREGLFMSLGDISVFYRSPVALAIWILVLIVMTLGLQRALLRKLFGIKVKELDLKIEE